MGSLGEIFNPILQFLQTGFAQVNAAQGLLIALFATVLMKHWNQLFAVALGASILHIIADKVVPMVTNGAKVGDIKLPALMEPAFWNYAAALYVGFVIIVAMFFAVKSVLFQRRGGKAKAH